MSVKKYYQIKPGFVWCDADGKKDPNCEFVTTDDPAIEGQEHKLDMTEEYEDAQPEPEKPVAPKPETPVAPKPEKPVAPKPAE